MAGQRARSAGAEFRDAANKSEYRLIRLSASQTPPPRRSLSSLARARDGPSCLREKSLSTAAGAPDEIRFSRSRISILMNFGF